MIMMMPCRFVLGLLVLNLVMALPPRYTRQVEPDNYDDDMDKVDVEYYDELTTDEPEIEISPLFPDEDNDPAPEASLEEEEEEQEGEQEITKETPITPSLIPSGSGVPGVLTGPNSQGEEELRLTPTETLHISGDSLGSGNMMSSGASGIYEKIPDPREYHSGEIRGSGGSGSFAEIDSGHISSEGSVEIGSALSGDLVSGESGDPIPRISGDFSSGISSGFVISDYEELISGASADFVSGVSGDLVSGVSGDFVSGVSGDLVSGVSGDFVSGVSGDLVSGVSGDFVSGVSGDLVSGVSGDFVSGFSGDFVSGASGDFISGVSGDFVSGVSGDFVSGVSGEFAFGISGDSVSGVSGDFVSGASGDFVSSVSGEFVSGVSGEFDFGISGDSVSGVSGDFVSGVSGDFVSGVSGDIGSGPSGDIVSGDSRDFGSGPSGDIISGDSRDFGSGSSGDIVSGDSGSGPSGDIVSGDSGSGPSGDIEGSQETIILTTSKEEEIIITVTTGPEEFKEGDSGESGVPELPLLPVTPWPPEETEVVTTLIPTVEEELSFITQTPFQEGTESTLGSGLPTSPEPGVTIIDIDIKGSVYCDDMKLVKVPALPKDTTHFYARYNRITRISKSDFANMNKLKRIDLTSNAISKIEDGALYGLPALEELVIRENNVAQLPALPKTMTLVDASHNYLDRTGIRNEAFKDMKGLLYLYLTDNSIDHIPIPLPDSLRSLHLQNNNIQMIHVDTFCKQHDMNYIRMALEDIRLDGNPVVLSRTPQAYVCLPRIPIGALI